MPSSTSADNGPARLMMIDSDRDRGGPSPNVTPPNAYSMTCGRCWNARIVNACPSSCTRTDTRTMATQATSSHPSRAWTPSNTASSQNDQSMRTGTPPMLMCARSSAMSR